MRILICGIVLLAVGLALSPFNPKLGQDDSEGFLPLSVILTGAGLFLTLTALAPTI
jgi:hypothetical protein